MKEIVNRYISNNVSLKHFHETYTHAHIEGWNKFVIP